MDYMAEAVNLAKTVKKDIPVAAIIVKDGEIISSAVNTREIDNDITSHAEILALRLAEKKLANWRLDGCDMYVTLEPCPMCGWAILESRISNLYFGSYDSKYGSFSKLNLDKISDSTTKIYGGIKEEECNLLLQDFFNKIRKN